MYRTLNYRNFSNAMKENNGNIKFYTLGPNIKKKTTDI